MDAVLVVLVFEVDQQIRDVRSIPRDHGTHHELVGMRIFHDPLILRIGMTGRLDALSRRADIGELHLAPAPAHPCSTRKRDLKLFPPAVSTPSS